MGLPATFPAGLNRPARNDERAGAASWDHCAGRDAGKKPRLQCPGYFADIVVVEGDPLAKIEVVVKTYVGS